MSYTLNESISSLTSLSQRFQTATPENPITGQEVSDFGGHIKNVLNLLVVSDIQTSQVTTLLEVAKSANLQKDLEQSLDIDTLKNLTTLLEVAKAANLQKDSEQDLKDAQHDAAISNSANVDAMHDTELARLDARDASQEAKIYAHDIKLSARQVKDNQHDGLIQSLEIAQNELIGINNVQTADIATLKIVRKDAANVFYVDRQFANQVEMLAQDAAALQGVSNRPFATPFSAKKAAITWLALNPTKQAIVEIAKGDTFTAADYVHEEHAVTVSMGGVGYVSGVELAFHGITYYFEGSTVETPLMNAAFLAAQVDNGFNWKKAVFCGQKVTNLGYNEHAQANIVLDIPDIENTHNGGWNTSLSGDVGVKRLKTDLLKANLVIGNKWGGKGFSKSKESLFFDIGRMSVDTGNPLIYFTKCHSKDVQVSIQSLELLGRCMTSLGHWSGTAADGTLGGVQDSNIRIDIKSIMLNPSYMYSPDGSNGVLNLIHNKTSKFAVSLPAFSTTVPKLMWVYGIQENNYYHFKGAKTKINNPTSDEMPFNLNLATSVLILDGWDIESNVNNTLFTLTSGKLILRNCKIFQTATQPIFNISAGATVVLENTHLVGKVCVAVGNGKIISKKSTSNIQAPYPVSGTAQQIAGMPALLKQVPVLRGDLLISKFYDEKLNQTELSFSNEAVFEYGTQWSEIPNPNQLRFALSETVSIPFGETVLVQYAGKTLEVNNAKTVVDGAGDVQNVVSLFMQQAIASNESKIAVPYEVVPIGYILGV
jgi:hypothetical protein